VSWTGRAESRALGRRRALLTVTHPPTRVPRAGRLQPWRAPPLPSSHARVLEEARSTCCLTGERKQCDAGKWDGRYRTMRGPPTGRPMSEVDDSDKLKAQFVSSAGRWPPGAALFCSLLLWEKKTNLFRGPLPLAPSLMVCIGVRTAVIKC